MGDPEDLEDSLALRLIEKDDFRDFITEVKCSTFLESIKEYYPGETKKYIYDKMVEALFGDGYIRKSFISKIVHYLITHCRIETIEEFYEPLVRYRAVMDNEPKEFLKLLKEAVQKFVICSPNVQHLEFKGQKMVVSRL